MGCTLLAPALVRERPALILHLFLCSESDPVPRLTCCPLRCPCSAPCAFECRAEQPRSTPARCSQLHSDPHPSYAKPICPNLLLSGACRCRVSLKTPQLLLVTPRAACTLLCYHRPLPPNLHHFVHVATPCPSLPTPLTFHSQYIRGFACADPLLTNRSPSTLVADASTAHLFARCTCLPLVLCAPAMGARAQGRPFCAAPNARLTAVTEQSDLQLGGRHAAGLG